MNGPNSLYVVDDDAMVRRSAVMALNSAGYRARAFSGGREFIDEMEQLKPGCVLLDVRMPEIDGFGVLRTLSDRLARFPVVVMTGHGDITTAVLAMKLGAADFLEKPFDETVLFAILDRISENMASHAHKDDDQEQARSKIAALTTREREVLSGLAAGLPNKLLAHQLSLSIRTVEMHRANLMDKLGAHALADALRIAFRADLPALPG